MKHISKYIRLVVIFLSITLSAAAINYPVYDDSGLREYCAYAASQVAQLPSQPFRSVSTATMPVSGVGQWASVPTLDGNGSPVPPSASVGPRRAGDERPGGRPNAGTGNETDSKNEIPLGNGLLPLLALSAAYALRLRAKKEEGD